MSIDTPSDTARRVAEGLAAADRLRRAGQVAQAEQLCRELLAIAPQSANVLNFLALLLSGRGAYGEAEGLFRRALAVLPKDSGLHNNLANLQRRIGNLPGAEESLRRAIALNPGHAEAYYNLGLVLDELNRPDEALAAQRRAVSLRPGYAEAQTRLGVLLQHGEKHADALRAFDAAIAARPDYFDAHYYRGDALTALERFDDATAAFDKALALSPGDARVLHALGNTLARARRDEGALEAYGKAIDAAPEFLEAHREYNVMAWTMGRHELNLTSYARARERVGDKPDLLLAEANQRLRHEQGQHAEQLLRKAHQSAPERLDVTNALARALTMQRKFGESIALLEDAIRMDPLAVYNHHELAIALLRVGEPAQARRTLEGALLQAPFDQLSLAFLTLAYRELGDSRLDSLVDLERFVRVYDVPPSAGFADVESFNRALAQDLFGLHTRHVEPFDQTLRGGTQTPGFLFAHPTRAIGAVRERINECVADYIARLPDDPSHPLFARKERGFSYSGAWSCRLRSSGFHTNHVHPEGWISSAYYVSLPDVVADETGRQGWIKFGESNIGLGERDRPARVVQPAVGKLVLFPSYFWHGTVPFASQDPRLTIAFDIVPGRAAPVPRAQGY